MPAASAGENPSESGVAVEGFESQRTEGREGLGALNEVLSEAAAPSAATSVTAYDELLDEVRVRCIQQMRAFAETVGIAKVDMDKLIDIKVRRVRGGKKRGDFKDRLVKVNLTYGEAEQKFKYACAPLFSPTIP